AQVDRREDREVVGAIGQVAHQQDDRDEPAEGLDEGPRPAVALEQAEQHPPFRHVARAERPLRHRPPSSPAAAGRSPDGRVSYLTVSVPVMFGWTVHWKG